MKRLGEGKFVLIAEIGVNYYDIAKERGISNMDAAKLMIREAQGAGIHAVKFQTYKAGTLAAKDSPYYWDITEEPTRSQYELFTKFDSFGYDEYRELKEYSDEVGVSRDTRECRKTGNPGGKRRIKGSYGRNRSPV